MKLESTAYSLCHLRGRSGLSVRNKGAYRDIDKYKQATYLLLVRQRRYGELKPNFNQSRGASLETPQLMFSAILEEFVHGRIFAQDMFFHGDKARTVCLVIFMDIED